MMENDPRRKGPRSPSVDSEDSSHRRRSRKYDRDRSPSPRRSRYRRSRSRERRSGSRERRRKESSRSQDWNKSSSQNPPQPNAIATGSTGYVPPVHNQYQQAPPPPNTSQPPPPLPPTYNQGYGNYNYNYNPQGYDYSYQQQAAGYRSDYPPQQNWPGGQVAYNNQQPPAAMPAQVEPARPVVEPAPPGLTPAAPRVDDTKKDAIANEVKQHKATLARQREEYVRKSTNLQNELEILREQCDEIGKDGRGDNNRFVKENQKLQIEIQNKMKKINNVIDMLTGIIGDKETVDDLKIKFKREIVKKRSRSPKEEFPKPKLSDSPDKSAASDNEKEVKTEREKKTSRISNEENSKPLYNVVHYDPEMHWCKICDIFPKTAKEYLNHLHSNEHKETCLERKIVDMPWHPRSGGGTEKEVPSYPDLPTKRIPIKGLQFFSAATAWYCKLCDSWIGDLHCASLHLKSKRHSENFSSFVEQNPHWETDWMADREKAFSDERQKQMQLEMQKQKEGDVPLTAQTKPKKSKKSKKNKKKSKKRKNKNSNSESSSESENSDSDSDQDMSKSIRVAMRNKMKASTQAILNEEIDYHGIKLKGPWNQINKSSNSGNPPQVDDDRQLLNSLRDKLKARQEEEIKTNDRRPTIDHHQVAVEEENGKNFSNKADPALEAWGPKEPPKPFWIKKDEEKPHSANKNIDIPKSDDIPKPHMGFWTKQPFNPPTKPLEKIEKEDERDRERDRYKDDRDRKYDRRDDKYHRYDNYDRRRRDRDRDYYDDRRKDRRNDDSPRRDRNYRESPKRNYDKYKDNRREDESNDESKFEKKTNESASKLKKVQMQTKKPPPPSNKSGKLPFIGRLPLFKKKTEEPKPLDKDITPLPYVQSKFEDTPKVPSDIINPPGVVHITKLATPVNLNNSIPIAAIQSAMKILVAPPPPVLNTSKATAPLTIINSQEVVDMEIEDQTDETIIEETIVDQTDKVNVSVNSSSHLAEKSSFSSTQSETTNSTVFSTTIPPPFLTSNPPPFVQNSTGFGPVPGTMPQFAHPPPMSAAFMQTHAPLPQMQQVEGQLSSDVSDHSEHPELPEPAKPSADPSQPLPEDLQEALNIIFPKDEVETTRKEPAENNAMYTTIYSGMLGCVEYGLEYMDQPPPEITQTEVDVDAQPGPDDLRMLGIDEGDTIL